MARQSQTSWMPHEYQLGHYSQLIFCSKESSGEAELAAHHDSSNIAGPARKRPERS